MSNILDHKSKISKTYPRPAESEFLGEDAWKSVLLIYAEYGSYLLHKYFIIKMCIKSIDWNTGK